MRNLARQEGKRFCDRQVLTYQAERMSEPIRSKVGGVSNTQMAVYEEFGRSIPGFVVSDNPANVVSFQRPIPVVEMVLNGVSCNHLSYSNKTGFQMKFQSSTNVASMKLNPLNK